MPGVEVRVANTSASLSPGARGPGCSQERGPYRRRAGPRMPRKPLSPLCQPTFRPITLKQGGNKILTEAELLAILHFKFPWEEHLRLEGNREHLVHKERTWINILLIGSFY